MHSSKLKGKTSLYGQISATDSASPAGDADSPVGMPGAELSHSALSESQDTVEYTEERKE